MLSVDHQRRLDAWIGPPLCWLLTMWHRAKRPRHAGPGSDVRALLVIALSEMGALVLARPMFDRLRAQYPGARLFVLCFAQNEEALELLEVVPREHIIGVRTESWLTLVADGMRAIRRVRALSLDVVLDLELFARVSAVVSGLSGAPIRVGFHRQTQEGLYRGSFLTRAVPYNPYRHIADQFVTLAESIGSTTVPSGKAVAAPKVATIPPMRLRPGELEAARRSLHDRFAGLEHRPLVFLGPGGGLLPVRAWPIAHYVSVAQNLTHRGLAVAVVGLPTDRSLAQTIQTACTDGVCVDLTGYTRSVRELTVLLHLGALLITNDGGTGHFASLTPIPTIVLYGPETPVLYGSLSPNAVNLHRPMSCSPCLTAYNHRRSPCDGDNVCLKSITPTEVLEAAYRLLGVNTPA